MQKPALKGALAPASALFLFFMGLETGGFQYSLLKLVGELSLGSAAMGLLPAAQYAAMTLAPLVIGRFSDRIDKKLLFLLGILSAALGCLLATRAASAPFLGLCVFLVGWGQGLGGFANAALLARVYDARSGALMNLTQSFFSLGAVASPLLTAYFTEHLGASWQLPFLLAGLGQLLALGLLYLADCSPCSDAPARPDSAPVSAEDLEAFSPFRSPFVLLLMVAILLYVSIENSATYFFGPLFSLEFAAASYSAYAISAFWLAMFFSRLLFGVLRLNVRKLVLACLAGLALCLLPLGFAQNALFALAACVGAGFLCGPVWPLLINEAARIHPAHAGAASAAGLAITGLGATVSPALMGLLGSLSDYRQVFVVLFAMCGVATALWVAYMRKQR